MYRILLQATKIYQIILKFLQPTFHEEINLLVSDMFPINASFIYLKYVVCTYSYRKLTIYYTQYIKRNKEHKNNIDSHLLPIYIIIKYFLKFLLLFSYICMPFLLIPPPHPSRTHLPPPPPPSPLILSVCHL